MSKVIPAAAAAAPIFAQMDFKPETSATLKSMPPEIFQPKWGGLQKILGAKTEQALPEAA